jgi:PAS domain S-box-containing protein
MAPGETPFSALKDALARAGDGVFVTRPAGCIVMWNRTAEKILGYSAREVIGRSCRDVLAGRDAEGEVLCREKCRPLTLVKHGMAVPNFDVQTCSKAGRLVWINVSILALPASPHSAALTVHLFRDVTARREERDVFHARVKAPAPETPGIEALLSRREIEILTLMSRGLGTRDLAARLDISRATVRNHIQSLFTKLGVHSRLEAVALATRRHSL